PNAAIPGTGQIIHTFGNLGFSPVSLGAWQTYYGAYFNETFDLTNRLSLTAGGRYNLAAIDMADLFGTSPDLSSSFTYARFNPVQRLHQKNTPGSEVVYGGISGSEPYTAPAGVGSQNPQKALLVGGLPRPPPAAAAGGRPHTRGRTTRQHQHRRRSRRLEARTVPHRQPKRHHPSPKHHPGPRRVPERSSYPSPRA